MANPKISVITPSFNQGAYIKDTIESVLAQNYAPFEHIVVDGGSTDNTVEILKQYPHIIWTSEKDGGQSDALNKAIAKTTGEIIAWINSDDWYEPGAFAIAAEALKEYPVVMGGCAIVNEKNQITLEVPNTGRIWFDLLKYWIGYSIPTQPSIFFKKELLPPLERTAGELFDKELYYEMDYDLWMRMAIRTPFVRTIDKRFAYYRMTETNKTGNSQGGMSFAEPEMSRVFHRSETMALSPAYAFSILLPVVELNDATRSTIETVLLQSIGDYELIVIALDIPGDPAKSAALFKDLQKYARERNAEQLRIRKDSYIKVVKAAASERFAALDVGFKTCEGRHVVALESGSMLGSTFLADALAAFANNRIGMLLPFAQSHALLQSLVPPGVATTGAADFVISRLFDCPELPLLFAVRRTALLECGDLLRNEPLQKILRELVATVLFKGWHVSVQNKLRATAPVASDAEKTFLETNRRRIAAEIVVALDARLQRELFAKSRAQHGTSLVFDDATVANCCSLIEKINQLQ